MRLERVMSYADKYLELGRISHDVGMLLLREIEHAERMGRREIDSEVVSNAVLQARYDALSVRARRD